MVNSTIAVSVKPSANSGLLAYDLTAIDAQGAAVHNFNGLPVLTVHYPTTGAAPAAIYYLDPDGRSLPLTSSVDTAAHTVSAPLPHFSTYAVGVPQAIVLSVQSTTPPGSAVLVTATVTDSTNGGVSGAPVSFTTDSGSLSAASCTTDANGQCSATLTGPSFAVANVTGGVDALTATLHIVFAGGVLTGTADVSHTQTTPTVGGNPATLDVFTLTNALLQAGLSGFGFGLMPDQSAITSSLILAVLTQGANTWKAIEGNGFKGQLTVGTFANATLSGISFQYQDFGGTAPNPVFDWST